MASSRARALVRASSRLATFAQHISSTKPTTPSRSSDVSCSSGPISQSRAGSTSSANPLPVAGIVARDAGADRGHVGPGGCRA